MADLALNSLSAKDLAYSLHPYTNLAVHEEKGPLVITRGEGIEVWDEDGKAYIDALGGLWCTALGFSEPRLVEAATRQLETLPFSHSFAHRAHPPTIELAERLIEIAPEPLAKAFFVNSGSEAVETAIKIAWYYQNALERPEKKKIIGRDRGYHGVLVASGSLTAIPFAQNDFDLPYGGRFLKVSTPCHYRYGAPGEDEEAFASRLAQELEDLILAEGPETVAAFIAGRASPPDKKMGRAGAIVSGGKGDYASKCRALERAGVAVADTPSQLPKLLRESLAAPAV